MLITAPPSDADGLSRARLRRPMTRPGRAEAAFERTGQPDLDARRPRQARRIATACLRLWGLSELVDSVCLALSELVTNAFTHGGGETVTVRLSFADGQLCFEVCNAGVWVAKPPFPDLLAQGGRGLLLVDAVADTWGITEDGTRVWCIIRVPQPEGSR
ncbi:ATP-binding protein [Streptomyces sp. 12297]